MIRCYILLAVSLGYVLVFGRGFWFLPLLTAGSAYWSARYAQKRWVVPLCLVGNFGILLLYKTRLNTLPLGISFYTFQAMSYVLDVRRRRIPAERKFCHVLLFVCYFPQLVQGPISRYDRLAPELTAKRYISAADLQSGCKRIVWGAFKKLVIADRAAIAVAALRNADCGGPGVALLSLLYAVRIYGDFTGGIDMALGLSNMLGVHLPENFAAPFLSESFPEYWRRWHITLGEWMKDYVFYPVSVSAPMRRFSRWSRKHLGKAGKKLPVYLASCITWIVTGLWHGLTPNFPLWGLLNFLVITVTQEFSLHRKGNRCLRVFTTFSLMNLVRLCDLYPNVADYGQRLWWLVSDFQADIPNLGLTAADWLILAAAFGISLKFDSRRGRLPDWAITALILVTAVFGVYGIGFQRENFIYNGF